MFNVLMTSFVFFFFFSSRRRHTRYWRDWSSDVCSSDLGVVDNEHWDDVDARFARYEGLPPGEKKRRVGAAVPFGRMARPEEISGLAAFLASADADYIVAQTYNIDGGNWMS